MKKLRVASVLFALVALIVIVSPVLAHASLLKSNPEANATLPRPPVQIELFFSEALESSFSSISVLNAEGAAVDSNDARVDVSDNTRLTISLRSIPDGVYTVSWKALSAVDGHVTTGSFPFAIGNVDPAALAAADQASKSIRFSFDEAIARWLLFLAATALTGGAIFKLVVWRERETSLFKRLDYLAVIVLVSANILAAISQAGQAGNTGFALPWEKSFTGVLFTTRFGTLWLARFALTLLVVRFLSSKETSFTKGGTLITTLGLLLTISLGSHAAADAQPTLPVILDWLHLIAASVWVGGLIHFAFGLWALKKVEGVGKEIATLIPRFSALALLSVSTLILTGLYAAVLRIGTLEALNTSLYGRTLIVKLIIALPMLALGAINLLVMTPAMKKTQDATGLQNLSGLFRKIVTSEVTLGAALFLSVGVLTALPPPQIASTVPALTAQQNVDDLNLALEITPGRVGQNTFTVQVMAGGAPVVNAQEVRLQFTSMAGKVPSSKVQLAHQGGGVYAIKGTYLSLPDSWQVQTVVRRAGQFDAYANFDFNVGANTAPAYAWYQINAIALLVCAVTYFFAFQRLTHTRRQWLGTGVAPALVLLLIGVNIYYNPPFAARVLPVNPIPPNANSITLGKELYEKNCVVCHGTSGKGDGPVGLTLNPRPADLTLHTTPGVHPDGQLYDWITNGFAGTAMPQFKLTLSDEQRWHLVNYIRTLASK